MLVVTFSSALGRRALLRRIESVRTMGATQGVGSEKIQAGELHDVAFKFGTLPAGTYHR